MATDRRPPAPPRTVEATLTWLKQRGSKKVRDGMARYAIPSDRAFGVPVGVLRARGKQLGPDHALAEALWQSGWYEARMLATFVDDPAQVTAAQMDRWARDFDNWAVCDTACFALFDRTPHAWRKVTQWAPRQGEFVRRAAFALLASLTVHDRQADDAAFARGLVLVERAATDPRNFVMKAVNWALRSVGKRSRGLNQAAVAVAERLAGATEPAPRWIGKHALRELTGASVRRRLAQRQ